MGRIGLNHLRPLKGLSRFGQFALLAQDAAHVGERFEVVRLQSDRLLIPCQGLIEPALVPGDDAQLEVYVGIRGIEGQRLLEPHRRFVEPVLPPQCDAQPDVRPAQRLIEPRRERMQRGLLSQHFAEAAMRVGEIGLEGKDLLKPVHRLIELPLMPQQHPQVAVYFGDVGPQGKNSFIARRGFGQTPGTMVADGLGKQGADVDWFRGLLAGHHHRIWSSRRRPMDQVDDFLPRWRA